MASMSPERWEQVQALFHDVLEQPSSERARYLARACDGDPDLKAQVEAMLTADHDPAEVFGSSLDTMAAELATQTSDGENVDADADADASVGSRVGPYQIVRRLGAGGMGVVYLAERADGQFTKKFALKLVKRGMDTDEILRRFRNERQILAGLQHAHIASLSDGGVTDDGRPYLVMEYVEGVPIDAYCDTNELSIEKRLALFQSVLEAVHYAHQNLVVHRDIKPSNILVGDDGSVKLLDFGIAKLLSDEDDGLTRTAMPVLTPAYAAPEQRSGGAVTTATDVFALGVVLCELLTGRRPQSGPGAKSATGSQTRTDRTRPSTLVGSETAAARATTVERLKKRLRGDLDTIVLKALQEDPRRRYASAEAFLADITRHLDGLPVLAQPDSVSYRFRKFVGRHRVGVAAATLFAITVVGFAVFASFQRAQTATARDRAEAERDKAEEVATFLADLFDASDPFAAESVRLDTMRVRALLDRGADRVRSSLADQPLVRAQMMNVIGNVYQNLGLHEEAESLLAESLTERERQLGEEHTDVAESLESLGRLYRATGDYEKSQDRFERALAIRENDLGSTALATSHAMAGLGSALRARGDYDQAEAVLTSALSIQREEFGTEHMDVAETMLELGRVFQDRGQPALAESLYREVVAIHRKTFGEGHPQVAASLDNLSIVLRQQTKLDEAAPFVQEALDIRRAALGPEHPQTLSSLYELASLSRDRGSFDEAVTLFKQVTDLDRKVLGERHHYVGLDLRELGITYARMKSFDEAISAYEQSLDILRDVLPPDHMDISVSVNGMGYTYLQMGEHPRAEQLLREALRMRVASLGEDSWQTGISKSALGECLMAQGRDEEAERLLVDGYETVRDANGPTASTIRRLVAFYEKVGREQEAAKYRAMAEG